eukprot:CAMPEP_0194246842 /NCGR_PEP_ID=MMETSP0158-20130606/15666_1 /TAXON_ID=33649 /ORGANISM="Thalassionema nitzschioides, Strain L26-B" /LENGTH=243 /DNA_ID=CAMNT_0038982843 /DNA_START=86 /DNA_END=818 /DNA_ORIENTATION=+
MSKIHKNDSFVASMRRNAAVRNKHSALPEEMQPMLKQEDDKGRIGANNKARSNMLEDDIKICVRDHRDAAGKRAYRVQVPKRMIFYTCLIFVLMPVFLFSYVETHRSSLKNAKGRTKKKNKIGRNITIMEEIEEAIEETAEFAETLVEEIAADIVGPTLTKSEEDQNITQVVESDSEPENIRNKTATSTNATPLTDETPAESNEIEEIEAEKDIEVQETEKENAETEEAEGTADTTEELSSDY